MISKTHISAQRPRGRQLNTKVCGSESAIFSFFFLSFLLRPQSSTTISRKRFNYSPSFYHKTDAYHSADLYNHSVSSYSYEFTQVDKTVLQLCPVAVRCVGRHFIMLYACTYVVSFPNQRLRSLVWERD